MVEEMLLEEEDTVMADNGIESYKEKLFDQKDEHSLCPSFDVGVHEGDISVTMEPTGPSIMLSNRSRNAFLERT
ncbi:conserved hypothetical protein [Ricinus communis]|uniref:Uncharacterized protein n=1 Tax=Ricinus communis TaxID=3988 RepID=B9RZ53_RICCO|nr:conserved hypothetical protein [Ricinus communis]